MDIENEYKGKVVLVTGSAKLFFQTLRKFNHQTFKKGLIQTNAFRKSLTKNAAQATQKETFTKERKLNTEVKR